MDSTNVSNIDDLLMGGQGNSQQPPTPESIESEVPEVYEDSPEPKEDLYGLEEKPQDDHTEDPQESEESDDESHDDHKKQEPEYDEYGNKTEGMKKRLKKQADKYEGRIQQLEAQIAQLTPNQQQQVQKAADNFEFDPNSDDDFQRQFETMVEQTLTNMQSRQQQESRLREEQEIQGNFERKLVSGMKRFEDFEQTIAELPCKIDYDMAQATRSLDDPAAFLYAAAKRHPQELERISKMRDPYAKVREMGKLEERMRKSKPTTQAPRPLGRAKEDAHLPVPKAKTEDSIEDLIAKNDAKKLAQVRARGRR